MWRATEAASAWRITRRADGQGYAVGFAEAGSLDNGFVNTKIEKSEGVTSVINAVQEKGLRVFAEAEAAKKAKREAKKAERKSQSQSSEESAQAQAQTAEQAQSTQEKPTADTERASFSPDDNQSSNISDSEIDSYDKEIDQIDNGTLNTNENTHLKVLGHTPKIYIDYAKASDLEIDMAWDIAYLAMKKSGDISGHYHGLGADTMKALPSALADPLYIVKQKNGRIAAVTKIVVKGKRAVFASIELEAYKTIIQGGITKSKKCNLIVTVTDAKPNYLQNTIFSGEIVYNKNNEDPAHFILRLKSLEKAVPTYDLAGSSDNRITESDEKSNNTSENSSENFQGDDTSYSPSADTTAPKDGTKPKTTKKRTQTESDEAIRNRLSARSVGEAKFSGADHDAARAEYSAIRRMSKLFDAAMQRRVEVQSGTGNSYSFAIKKELPPRLYLLELRKNPRQFLTTVYPLPMKMSTPKTKKVFLPPRTVM